MATRWEVAVLIPAHNEEALLARCLESVMQSIDALPANVRGTVVLVSDGSTDRTAEIGRTLIGARGHVLNTRARTVGTARAYAASFAMKNTLTPFPRIWLANTDADCVVPRAWLADQIHLATKGIEAVAGIISVDNFDEHGPEVPERFRATYSIYADGTHPHVHGANLGVRADRYIAAGGWADLKTAEDHDLWRRLRRNGTRLLSSARIHVVTSGRRVGRAPHGFAGALAAHNRTEFFA